MERNTVSSLRLTAELNDAMQMLKDGSVTITFETSPDIPVFHFDPVEPVS